MLVLQSKQVNAFLLLMVCCCALAIGYMCAQVAGYLLQPTSGSTTETGRSDNRSEVSTVDTGMIIKGNIFVPAERGDEMEVAVEAEPTPIVENRNSNLKLLGTIEGGDNPLALIEVDGKVMIFGLDDSIPGSGELHTIQRNEVVILLADGSRNRLTIEKNELASATQAPSSLTGDGIRDLGNNRWSVSRDEVEQARSNINRLLKSARMEPNIVNGKTEGFVVKMIRPRSLLARLGIRRDDTVTRVNGVELNSPEKALQIFQ